VPNPAWVELAAGEAREPVEVWFADAAPPDTLLRRWDQVLLSRLPHPAILDRDSGILWEPSPETPWPGVPPDLAAVGLDWFAVPEPWLEARDEASYDRFRQDLAEAKWKSAVIQDPLRIERSEARRIPFDAVDHRPGADGTFRLRASRAGLRRAGARAATGRTAQAERFVVAGLGPSLGAEDRPREPSSEAFPGEGRLLAAYLEGTGTRPVRFLEGPFLGTGGASLPFSAAPERNLRDLLWNLAWRGPLQGALASFHTGPMDLAAPSSGERRLRRYVAALGGGPLAVTWRGEAGEGIADALDGLLPITGRTAEAVDLFLTGTAAGSYPRHFVFSGGDREVHVFFNLGERRESHRVRLPVGFRPTDGTGKILVFEADARTVRGLFSPFAILGLVVPPRDARHFTVVPDRTRPYLVATGAHWTEGIEELREEAWDEGNGVLELRLGRRPGARGELAVACTAKPRGVEAEGGRVGTPIYHGRGAKPVALLPVVWDAEELTIRVRFDPEP